jgi:hypothetical protein
MDDRKKSATDEKPAGKPPALEEESPEAEPPKADPARYGDWTVNGIAVDF